MKLEEVKACVPKFLSLLDQGLTSGMGVPFPGRMCVEAAWCNALGLPHSDNPPCVGRAVRTAKIKLNDSRWSSNKTRAEGLRAIGLAQMGSDGIDQVEFARILVEALPDLLQRHGDANRYFISHNIESLRHYLRMAQESRYYQVRELKAEYAVEFAIQAVRAKTSVDKNNDPVLLEFAGVILNALKELNSPGCEWLPMITNP